MSGNSLATALNASSQQTMPQIRAFDFVIDVTLFRRCRAALKAARMIRSQPRRVNTAVWIATSGAVRG